LCADLAAKYPKFSGTGYIAFPVLRGAHREFHVIMEMRPDVLDGLVLFSAGQPDAQSDFFSLALQRGRIELRYTVKIFIRISTDTLWRVFRILTELVSYTLVTRKSTE